MNVSFNYYYSFYVTKQDYNRVFENVYKKSFECFDLSFTQIAKIYYVKENSLQKTIFWIRRKKRNTNDLYNHYKKNNKIFNKA